MATHANADSDMSIVYFSLTINDKKKTIKAERLSDPNKRKDIYFTKIVVGLFFERSYVFSKFFNIFLTVQT